MLRALRSARAAEPTLTEPKLLDLVTSKDNSGLALRLVRIALDYWAAYPDEVDALVNHAARIEDGQLAAAERARDLLAG